jgi:flagellar hook protein FlgE
MLRSMNSAITGLKAHQMYMDVIGNNIANVNTTAFKSGRITFQNMLSSTIRSAVAPTEARGGINSVQVGMGTAVAAVETVNTQGGFNTTSKVTDMAIQGDGFFVMTDGFQRFYTRDGAFDLDQSGNLISPNSGLRVSGWMADNGVIDNTRPPSGTININLGQSVAAKPTSAVEFTGNLNGKATHVLQTGVMEAPTEPNLGQTPSLGFKVNSDDTITFTYNGETFTTPVGDGIPSGSPGGPTASANGGLSEHLPNTQLGSNTWPPVLAPLTNLDADIEFAMNVALANAGKLVVNGVVQPAGPASVTAIAREDRPIQIRVIDDGGVEGGEARLEIHSDKSLTFGNAPSSNLELAKALRNRDAPGLTVVNTVMQVYDSLGNAHDVNVTFEKVTRIEDPTTGPPAVYIQSPDTWKWSVEGADIDVTGIDPTQLPPNNTIGAAFGFVKFDQTGGFRAVETREMNGAAVSPKTLISQPSKAVAMINWKNGAADQQLVTLDFSRITQLQDGNTVTESKNDGFETGTLMSFVIGADGVILGQYSNGKTNPLGQVALANFANVAGLTQVGSNMFTESANSGLAQIGEPRTGSRGSINAGQLEMSNVDLAAQFTDMIRAQRGFQANSRIITTSDEMLQDLVNLKR